MQVQLIPLLEITNYGQNLESPGRGPGIEFHEEWDDYHAQSHAVAGFDPMTPYLPGTSFFLLEKVSDANLLLIMKRELAEVESVVTEDPSLAPMSCVLQGGYLLRVDGQDVLFPQCCCDLADIQTWKNLATGAADQLLVGYPSPIIQVDGDKLVFDLTRGDSGETFYPPAPVKEIAIDRHALLKAVLETEKEMQVFVQRLEKIAAIGGIEEKRMAEMFVYDLLPEDPE